MASIINADVSGGLKTTADTSGQLQLQTASTTAMTVTSGQLVGVGTTSPSAKLHVSQSGNPVAQFTRSDSGTGLIVAADSDGPYFRPETASAIRFNNSANTVENMRIDTSGNLLVGTTTNSNSARSIIYKTGNIPTLELKQGDAGAYNLVSTAFNNGGTYYHVTWVDGAAGVHGSITSNGTNVAYNTSSDYRLKENIVDLPNALTTVLNLKPRQFDWKSSGQTTTGFIAHELQEVVPDCVTGEKDAVDAEGNPVYQGIDTSFLVATLTAAIQELKAELDATKAEVAAMIRSA